MDDESYMKRCLELARRALARGDAPVGSLLVREGRVVGEGLESVRSQRDPAGHAEISAIRAATVRLNSSNLTGATLYTTVEPCFMCSYVIRQCRVSRIVFGVPVLTVGGSSSRFPILIDPQIDNWGRPPQVRRNVLREECEALLHLHRESKGAGGPDRAHRLTREFFERPTVTVARDLLGKRLVRIEGAVRLSGLVMETEAYVGGEDLGCHAKSGRTRRNEQLWGPPGSIYVYFTYGMHWMLNAVTESEGTPAAVLIRAIRPEEGREVMCERRQGREEALVDGPAKICQALAIDRRFLGKDLCSDDSEIFLEDTPSIPDSLITTGPRIGLNSVPEPWKSIPWRFQTKWE